MGKKIVVLMLVIMLGFTGISYAQRVMANASPAIVELSGSSSVELTFPYKTRDVVIANYDSTSGIWINLKGEDTDSINIVRNRHYLGPSSKLELYDFVTEAMTIFVDNIYTGGNTASPVTVLSTY